MQALSDLAAMGASPVGALVALGLPGDRSVDVDVGFEDEGGAGLGAVASCVGRDGRRGRGVGGHRVPHRGRGRVVGGAAAWWR